MDGKGHGDDWRSLLNCLSLTGYLGFLMVGTILGGLLIGWFLDRWLGTELIFKIVFIVLGVAGGFFNVYRQISRRIK